jgi:phosphomannomutase
LYDALPHYYNTPELRIDCPDDQKFSVIEQIKNDLDPRTIKDILAVDGLRVTTDDGWWLIRASNTQGALIVRCESPTTEGFERLKALLKEHLRPFKLEVLF